MKYLLLLTGILAGVQAIAQTPDANGIVYVKPTATGSGDGSSWGDATSDLHNAIQAANVQKVFVAEGTYKVGAHSFIMKNGVEVYGGFNPGAGIDDLSDSRIIPTSTTFSGGSILDGEDTRPVIWNVCASDQQMDHTAVLDGFTVANGHHYSGGGIYNVYASPTFRNLLIKNNIADGGGGGIYNEYAAPVIMNTIFYKNFAQEGGAIWDATVAAVPMTLTNVSFIKNEALYSYVTIRGTGVVDTRSDVIFTNVTMADNYGYAIFLNGGARTIRNSIILGGIRIKSGSYQAQYSGIEGHAETSDGNLSAVGLNRDVLFNSPQTEDYTLRSCSPAINAGDNALYTDLNSGVRDLAGNARLINGTIDLGAYETGKIAGTPDANGVIYVKTIASGNGSGNSWANATDNLRGAAHLNGVRQVWVEKGIYNFEVETGTWPWSWALYKFGSSLAMKNNVAIYGGFDPGNGVNDLNDARILPDADNLQGTIINGSNAVPGVWNIFTEATALDHTAVLDGFTLTGGDSETDGAGINNEYASPTLRNLVIKGNTAVYGAGVFNRNASPVMTNVVIKNNSASADGGGMYNDASSVPLMTNVHVTGNSGRHGGGIYNRNSSPVLTNVVVTGNTASATGGGMYNSSSSAPRLLNVSMAGNLPDAFRSDNSNVSLANTIVYGAIDDIQYTSSYSLVENSTSTANGNIDATGIAVTDVFADPANGDYRLKPTSPAVDGGSNDLYPGLNNLTTDLAGNARVYNFAGSGAIDMGAYESSYEVTITPDVNGVVYVQTARAGNGTGSSWANATRDLQGAINAAGANTVWVATGKYNVPSPNSFVMKNNVAIYGGFDPVNGIDDLDDQRILPAHGTEEGSVLAGKGERPVIWNNQNGLTETAILDGFTIKDGASSTNGGGIMNAYASPTLRNLVIKANYATNGGGGISNLYSSPAIVNVAITGNSAGIGGGGILNVETSSPSLVNVQITGNSAPAGAGVWFHTGSGIATFTQVTLAANYPGEAAAIVSGTVNLNNSIVYGGVTGSYNARYSLVEGNTPGGEGNPDATGITPGDLFSDPAAGDFTLAACSPATNAGAFDVSGLNLPAFDLGGKPRLFAGRVDLGAHENIHIAGNPGIASLPAEVKGWQKKNGTTNYYNSCNEMLASVETTGAADNIEGLTTARVWIDGVQAAQYVRRHYEITPAGNAAAASGRVILYFTQSDFDAFNAANPALPLPDGPSGNVANLLVEKRGGTSSDGTGRPHTYPGEPETISNVTVVWNSMQQRWEVSFNTTGFSGFFVKTLAGPLPVRWISFTAGLNDNGHSVLEWKADEANVAGYQVERSSNARDFYVIGTRAAGGTGIVQYSFTDPHAVVGLVYYRIRETDLDGALGYSRIERVQGRAESALKAYPNPARDQVTVRVGTEYLGTSLRLVNAAGVGLQQLTVREPVLVLHLDRYPPGIYMLCTFDGRVVRVIKE
ncbi:choice-of-anchor Q domain-containing protein [Ravibacter arvi]